MATDATNVQVAATGAVYVAPAGTTLPTTVDAVLNVAFTELGLISEDGVTESQGTDTNDIRAWQNGAVVRRVQTSHELSYQFTALETNPTVVEEFYGNYADGLVEIDGSQPEAKCWVLEVFDGDEHIRVVIGAGQVTERGDVQYVNGEAIAYPFTVTAYPYDGDVKARVLYATDTVLDETP